MERLKSGHIYSINGHVLTSKPSPRLIKWTRPNLQKKNAIVITCAHAQLYEVGVDNGWVKLLVHRKQFAIRITIDNTKLNN